MLKESYIPKNNRKKILLITDDIRVPSGVAHIAREMVINTAHHYNWIQLAGSIKHPEKGKIIDVSQEANKHLDINDASIFLYPTDGYGNPDLLRQIITLEKPDALFLITDPRYFTWVFQMENEIRRKIPIIYLNIWDSVPAPAYNTEFYESCDALLGISKQTVNINEVVLGESTKNKVIRYVPHGINNKMFYPIEQPDEEFFKFKNALLNNKEYDFVLLFNSRNIRRKSIPDTILAWKLFKDKLPKDKSDKVAFVLHTDAIDENGTDLLATIEYFFPNDDSNIIITNVKFNGIQMNYLYNCSDGVILLSSNEGWGLSLTEALLTGKTIIANVTGGMQDQMRFVDDNGKWFTPTPDIPSNHRGTYKECGKWALPVFPSNLSIAGSVPTPYIFDDRCRFEDAAEQIEVLYNMTPEERKSRGLAGKEWATGDEAGFTSEKMSIRVIDGVDELFLTWKPRSKYEFLKDTDFKKRTLKHKLIY
jgi:glycosyltransferase involved in cell wall biosynthesis